MGGEGLRGGRSGGQGATGGQPAGLVTAEDVAWLVAHLRVVVAASSAVWAGRGLTLLQLTVLHLIGAFGSGDPDLLGPGRGVPERRRPLRWSIG